MIGLAWIDAFELKGPKAKTIKAKESKDSLNDLDNNQEL